MSEKLLKIADIAIKCNYSLSHTKKAIITRLDFPAPIKVAGDPRWLESEIDQFLKSLKKD